MILFFLPLQENTIIFPSELSSSSAIWTLSSGKDSIYKFFDSNTVRAQTRPSHIHFPTSEKFQETTFRQFSDFQINYTKNKRENWQQNNEFNIWHAAACS